MRQNSIKGVEDFISVEEHVVGVNLSISERLIYKVKEQKVGYRLESCSAELEDDGQNLNLNSTSSNQFGGVSFGSLGGEYDTGLLGSTSSSRGADLED